MASPNSGATDTTLMFMPSVFLLSMGKRVRNDELIDDTVPQAAASRLGQDGVRHGGGHARRAVLQNGFRCRHERAARIDLVINDDCLAAFHVANHGDAFSAVAVAKSALFDDGQRLPPTLRHVTRALRAAHVRGDNDTGRISIKEIVGDQRQGGQLIHGNAEKPLDLSGVEVHGENPFRARHLDEVCYKSPRNGNARLVFLVRAAIGVIRERQP